MYYWFGKLIPRRIDSRDGWESVMNARAKLISVFSERKQALLDELVVVHCALVEAKPSEETRDWLEKLEKWHNELHALIDAMPEAK